MLKFVENEDRCKFVLHEVPRTEEELHQFETLKHAKTLEEMKEIIEKEAGCELQIKTKPGWLFETNVLCMKSPVLATIDFLPVEEKSKTLSLAERLTQSQNLELTETEVMFLELEILFNIFHCF